MGTPEEQAVAAVPLDELEARNAELRAELETANEALEAAVEKSREAVSGSVGLTDEDVRRLEHPDEFKR